MKKVTKKGNKSGAQQRPAQQQQQRPPAQQQQRPGAGTNVATAKVQLPAGIELSKEFGPRAGLQGAVASSFALPFLLVLQKMSPQLDKNDALFIDGANEGDILNTATNDVFDGQEGIICLPVEFKQSYTLWGLREKGGGFKGEVPLSDPQFATTHQDEKNRNILPDGATQMVDTRLHGVALIDDGVAKPALISMTSTQIKKSKRWNTMMDEAQQKDGLGTWAHVYKLTTIPEKNDKGSWMGWNIEPIGMVQDQQHVNVAEAFYRALGTGGAKMQASANMHAAGAE